VTDSPNLNEPLGKIEALMRSAADYVQVSKDLRPRVIDAARQTSSERRVRHYIRQAALMAALLTWFVTASVNRLDIRDDVRELSLTATSTYPVSHNRIRGGAGDAAWVLVEAYTELRVRQADVLHLKL
jgi:hypothetical protein